ncbi:MAG TPA: hypothetical protein VK809_07025 [Bacteroidia bacterium]|jgi:hypothetical protein|nr:hypothetical protein [Bacteroidia bacterium]
MNININNYEAYFLDYHEGSLSPALVKELMEFISQHPELKEEFESFEQVTLTDRENINFDKKELLKKSVTGINAANFDEHAIQFVEGTLPVCLQNELKTFISQNPQYKKELELYSKTKLVPDTNIVFEDKDLLKKGKKRSVVLFYWSAAASVAIIIGAYFFLNRSVVPAPNGNNIVKHTQVKDSNTVVKKIVTPIDSNVVAPKIAPNIPVKNAVRNNSVALNGTAKKRHRKDIAVPNNYKDETQVAVRSKNEILLLPFRLQNNISLVPENIQTTSYSNFQDTTLIFAWMKKYNSVNNNPVNYATTDEPKDYKRSKFLYLLAKYTCKGLHKITGQHIEFQKKYDSDTTNIIAYQLDLGNKKINFPVKE